MDELKEQISDAIEVAKDKAPMTPVEVAERNLTVGMVPFVKSLHNFSKKDLIRVMKHVVLGPYVEVKFTSAKEGRLASLADQMLVCRFILQRDQMLKDDAKKLAQEQSKQNVTEVVTETQGENNGSETTKID